jgi:Domain of unknown function (DUF4352)
MGEDSDKRKEPGQVPTSQITPRETDHAQDPAIPARVVPARRRARGANVLLLAAVVAALAAGVWGVISSLGTEAPPARVGEAVEVSGGSFVVDRVTPEHMAPMQSSKFSAGGMNMSSMGMDMAPEGYERFAVVVTLAADEDGALSYSPEDFRVSGGGMKEDGPVRSELDASTIPAGSAVSGNLVFQAPEEASKLRLSLDGGRSVALDLEQVAGDSGHAHGGQLEGDGHDH